MIEAGEAIIANEAEAQTDPAMRAAILESMKNAAFVPPEHKRVIAMPDGCDLVAGKIPAQSDRYHSPIVRRVPRYPEPCPARDASL
ncbi:hypothetical protein AA21291_1640 [Swaminathania salitolerans LMG 21291]|uniref:Uncharacterized protein n=1 Tax=Swaminathania salitolerans TaxID=182838 RepID=A0A511BMZ4_9PROT|nr:hypothetical protein AA21291_1640 [Swaminathania salitolerans LMG 21291]GEL01717.1 hypothetical protein SSA02_08800 [Swaminathania salitolerans]